MVGAHVDPGHFESLKADYETGRKGRAKILANNPDWLSSSEQREHVATLLERANQKGRISGYIDYATIARRGDCEIHYILFRQLSADAAHASLESLERYFETAVDGSVTRLNAVAADESPLINETIDVLCNFMFLASTIYLEHT